MKRLKDTLIYAVRGDSRAFLFTFTKAKQPFDLTGATLTFTMKKSKKDSDDLAIIQKQLAIRDAEAGTAQLELTAEEMDVELISYFYDIQLERGGEVKTVQKGLIKFDYDVTRGNYG